MAAEGCRVRRERRVRVSVCARHQCPASKAASWRHLMPHMPMHAGRASRSRVGAPLEGHARGCPAEGISNSKKSNNERQLYMDPDTRR